MRNTNAGGPAFPTNDMHTPEMGLIRGKGGMTLRDYFAAKAMQQLMRERGERPIKMVADFAYDWADEMLRARAS